MSPRSEEQNTQIKDERREQILSAALKIFATRGFAAAKVGDIVASSGVSHGLLYHYFSSKEEIFHALVRRAVDVAVQSLQMVDGLPIEPLEKVAQTAKYILQGINAGQDSSYYFMIVVQASVMEGTPEEKLRYLEGMEIPIKIMVKILSEGQQKGEIAKGDVMEMATAFFAAIQGIAMYKLSMPDFKMPDYKILVNMVKTNESEG